MEELKMKKCIKCNKESEGNFCVYCGEKLLGEGEIEKIKERLEKENLQRIIEAMEQEKSNNEIKSKLEESNVVFYITITILTIIIIIMGIYAFSKKGEYEDEISDLKSQISRLNRNYNELESEKDSEWRKNSEKIEFLDENIVFVIDGYGDYYYTYDQMETVTQGIGSYTYWAYNKEQAIYRGYKAWK